MNNIFYLYPINNKTLGLPLPPTTKPIFSGRRANSNNQSLFPNSFPSFLHPPASALPGPIHKNTTYIPPQSTSGRRLRQVQPDGKASSSILSSNNFWRSSACLFNVSLISPNVTAIASCFWSRRFCCCSRAFRRASHAASEALELLGGLETISFLLCVCVGKKKMIKFFFLQKILGGGGKGGRYVRNMGM